MPRKRLIMLLVAVFVAGFFISPLWTWLNTPEVIVTTRHHYIPPIADSELMRASLGHTPLTLTGQDGYYMPYSEELHSGGIYVSYDCSYGKTPLQKFFRR